MKILMVGTNFRAMIDDVRHGLNPNSIRQFRINSGLFELTDESTIRVIRIEKPHDFDQIRGVRFDLVLEHSSFPRDAEMFATLRAYTHR